MIEGVGRRYEVRERGGGRYEIRKKTTGEILRGGIV